MNICLVLYQNETTGEFHTIIDTQNILVASTLFAVHLAVTLYGNSSEKYGGFKFYKFNGNLFNRTESFTCLTRVNKLQYAFENASPDHIPDSVKLCVCCFTIEHISVLGKYDVLLKSFNILIFNDKNS